jgi:uncharacterized damage-inducible protein DinB
MKELLQSYAAYNVWADQQLVDRVLKLPEEMHTTTVAGSFPGLQSTILHLLDAAGIWWQRIKLQEMVIRPSENFRGTTRDAAIALLQQDKLWEQWVVQASEAALQQVFAYRNAKKEPFKQPVCQMLLHLFNHASYTRGQLVTQLHQVGAHDIPNTDYIGWSRSQEL